MRITAIAAGGRPEERAKIVSRSLLIGAHKGYRAVEVKVVESRVKDAPRSLEQTEAQPIIAA
jgi:hypothetical protein